jgi:hypothetical protein
MANGFGRAAVAFKESQIVLQVFKKKCIPEYTRTFIFLDAIVLDMVTFTNGPIFSARAQSTTLQCTTVFTPPNSIPSSFKMSNEDKARAAAAQLVIDDEPDDWCVAVAERSGEERMS